MAQDISDEVLRQDVHAALTLDAVSDIEDINIGIADGVVTLTGSVQSWPEKQAAARAAKAVRGVKAVQNNIDIHYLDKRPDREIEAEIIHRLRWDAFVDHALVDVRVQNGKVMLSGVVGSAAEKRIAIANAGISGVTDIDGAGLEVKTWARTPELRENKYVVKSDEELRQAIEALFREAPLVKAYRVVPDVANGVVTLRGTVDHLKAKQAAARVAQRTVGVQRVINRLKVRTSNTSIRGDTLESEVRGALTRDPYVHRYKISVEVVDGVAHLYGAVNSFFEKYRAEDVAAQAKGVQAVENHIRSIKNATPYVSNPYIDDEWDADDDIRDVYTPRMTLKPDSRIKEDIDEELRRSPFVNVDEVTVNVVNGIATLSGAVESESERRAALENAYEGGAIRVNSQIEVK